MKVKLILNQGKSYFIERGRGFFFLNKEIYKFANHMQFMLMNTNDVDV